MNRRSFLALAAASASLPAVALADVQPSALLGAVGDDAFLAWLNGFYARELAGGWSTTVLTQVLSGLAPDPRVLAHNASQPEFAKPISDYINGVISAQRIALEPKIIDLAVNR